MMTALRFFRRTLKYVLVAWGAYLLVMLYIQRFGLATALWLLVFPLIWGFLSYFSDSTPPPEA